MWRHRELDFINTRKNGLLYAVTGSLNTSPYRPHACYDSSEDHSEAIEDLKAACFARILLFFLSSFSLWHLHGFLNSCILPQKCTTFYRLRAESRQNFAFQYARMPAKSRCICVIVYYFYKEKKRFCRDYFFEHINA